MLRSRLGPIAAVSLVAILATASARGADVPAAPAGAPIVNAAPDTGASNDRANDAHSTNNGPVESGGSSAKSSATPPAKAARHDDQGPGPAIEHAAQETGRALDRGTKGFRDGAENFFKSVGRFFSGDK
jgi:hypothetical protein